MEYIIFDLEWNNGFSSSLNKSINEIIEIGAVRLDSNLRIVSTFKQMIKTKFTGKLAKRVTELTHITNEEMQQQGIDFSVAIERFASWVGSSDCVFMSWSDSDMYVLAESTGLYSDVRFDFIKRYADLQSYCQRFIDEQTNNQISLLNASVKFGIESDEEVLHRALTDCYLSAKCFKHCFDEKVFAEYVRVCDEQFFERLLFKPYYITDLKESGINLDDYSVKCSKCKIKLARISKWKNVNNSFRTIMLCRRCHTKFFANYSVKQKYKKIEVNKRVTPLNSQKRRNAPKAKSAEEKNRL